MRIAGYNYSTETNHNHPDVYYIMPLESAYTVSGSWTYLPYGDAGRADELEETLHQMMREGKLRIPFNYSSSLTDIKRRHYSYNYYTEEV